MQQLNLPTYPIKIIQKEGKPYIFDIVRKKYLQLTPEEWVRQHWVHYLHFDKHYPLSLISVESGLRVNKNANRSDLLCYDRQGRKRVVVECKAPEVKITQKAFDQIARYNLTLKADYLVVTNGLTHYCCQIDLATGSYEFRQDVPDFPTLLHGVE
ncbi:MAG: type I restriction enzyme HsdR N-terminal domain-containing protein [Bacteroidales bacterium]